MKLELCERKKNIGEGKCDEKGRRMKKEKRRVEV